jgi:cysteine-rich repeat protein
VALPFFIALRSRALSLGALAAALAVILLQCHGGSSPAPADSSAASVAFCGDGVVQAGEECDDGNPSNDDGCLTNCFRPASWVPSDPHVHSQGCEGHGAPPPQLLELLEARGIRVGAALVWGVGYRVDSQLFTGGDSPVSNGGNILHFDLEVSAFPADRTGHLVALGLERLDFSDNPFASPRTGIPIADWAHAQGSRVVVGMAHGSFWPTGGRFPSPPVVCCMPWELPIQVARGAASFLSTERRGFGPPVDEGTFTLLRTLANSGFRLSLMGASDFPCIHRTIEDDAPRTDLLLDGELTYDRWLEALRLGRTTVALGENHLNLRVNGAPLGSEVRVHAGDVLLVSLESASAAANDVVLVVNGVDSGTVHLEGGNQVATVRLPVATSSWILARGRWVTTSPTYVLVDDKPIRASADDACYLMRYADHLTALVRGREIDVGEDTALALGAYAQARAEFQKRFTEAGGQACF